MAVKEPLTIEARQALLEQELSRYLKSGWLVQSQTSTRAQLYRKRERGCLGKLFFGLWDLIFKRKADVVLISVDEQGKIHTEKTRTHV